MDEQKLARQTLDQIPESNPNAKQIIDVIKERFKARMRGNLPMPVEKMLEAKHGMYDSLDCNLKLDGNYNIEDVLNALSLK